MGRKRTRSAAAVSGKKDVSSEDSEKTQDSDVGENVVEYSLSGENDDNNCPVLCPECAVISKNMRASRDHFWRTHVSPKKCQHCKSVMSKAYLDAHVRKMHSGPIKCLICNETCQNRFQMLRHRKTATHLKQLRRVPDSSKYLCL
jgi:hypothetical protein